MPSDTKVRLHAVIDGRVQGVGFRFFVIERALPLKITGWVRNTAEGQVEVLAEGEEQNLKHLLDALRTGPRAAYVTNVNVDWQTANGEFARFDVRAND
jgi:acylphosphatase